MSRHESILPLKQTVASNPIMNSLNRFLLSFAILASLSLPTFAGEPTGRWKGRWSSSSTGHSGPMRARITPTESGTYNAVFAGRFAGVIPFVYRAEMVPTQSWNGTVYVTEKKLPLLGSYRMQSIVPGSSLNANWSAVGDTGQVHMHRIGY